MFGPPACEEAETFSADMNEGLHHWIMFGVRGALLTPCVRSTNPSWKGRFLLLLPERRMTNLTQH